MSNKTHSSQSPMVTVIMPIRNEEKFIERSLGAVLNQTYPSDKLEVIVADGMSDDKTRDVIAELQSKTDVSIKIVDNEQRIVPPGFNLALEHASGEIIVRVDGHTIIEPDYVEMCVQLLEETGYHNVGGRMDAVGENYFASVVALATSSPFGVGGAKFHYATEETLVDTVYMGAWRKETFDKIGGFDENFLRSQDSEFNYRLRAHGGKILLSPRIKSTYYARSSLQKLWKQYYQYGYYKFRVIQKHPGQMQVRQMVPPVFVVGVLSGLFILPFNTPLRVLWWLAIAAYLLLDAVFSLRMARKHGAQYFFGLFVVHLIVHISWGLGFLRSLISFNNRLTERYEATFQV